MAVGTIGRPSERVFKHDGHVLTLAQWAERTGIPYKTLEKRILVHRWQLAKALTAPVRKRWVTIDGETRSLLEWCRHYGVDPQTARKRILKGFDPVIAVSVKRAVRAKVERWRCRSCTWTGVKKELAVVGVFRACPACKGRVTREEKKV